MYETDEEAPTVIVDGADTGTDETAETPKRAIRKALAEDDAEEDAKEEVEVPKDAARKVANDDDEAEPPKRVVVRKTLNENDGDTGEVELPKRMTPRKTISVSAERAAAAPRAARKIVRTNVSGARRSSRVPDVSVSSRSAARKRNRPVKRT